MSGFGINVCPSVQDRLKSPRASCLYFSLARRTGAVICCLFHVKSTHARCLRSSLARRTGAITVREKFRKRENLVKVAIIEFFCSSKTRIFVTPKSAKT